MREKWGGHGGFLLSFLSISSVRLTGERERACTREQEQFNHCSIASHCPSHGDHPGYFLCYSSFSDFGSVLYRIYDLGGIFNVKFCFLI